MAAAAPAAAVARLHIVASSNCWLCRPIVRHPSSLIEPHAARQLLGTRAAYDASAAGAAGAAAGAAGGGFFPDNSVTILLSCGAFTPSIFSTCLPSCDAMPHTSGAK